MIYYLLCFQLLMLFIGYPHHPKVIAHAQMREVTSDFTVDSVDRSADETRSSLFAYQQYLYSIACDEVATK